MPDFYDIAKEKGFHSQAVSYCIEFFPAPLPSGDDNLSGINICDPMSLCGMSHHFGAYTELFLPSEETVVITIGDDDGNPIPNAEEIKIPRNDFIDFQLMQMDLETLWNYPSRFDLTFDDDELVKLLLSPDAVDNNGTSYLTLSENGECDALERDLEWYVADCGGLHIHKPENPEHFSSWQKNKKKGLALLEKLRKEQPEFLFERLRECMFNEDFGYLSFLETEIDENYMDVVHKYSEWNCDLMIVSYGDFWTYYRPHSHEQPMNYFATSSWELRSMYLRNYDEGEPL